MGYRNDGRCKTVWGLLPHPFFHILPATLALHVPLGRCSLLLSQLGEWLSGGEAIATMKPTELFKVILAAFSFLGELAKVMRSNGIPVAKQGRISASKTRVTEGATVWEIGRADQARLMLQAQGKPINTESVEKMARHIEAADAQAKAGYALEKAFGVKVDALYSAAKDVEGADKGKGKAKGATPEPDSQIHEVKKVA